MKPYYLSEAEWLAVRRAERGYAAPFPVSQVRWADGLTSDREDEHDGTEPENEHGPGWTEANSRLQGVMHAFPEDGEPSLSLTEHVNQATRTVPVSSGFWSVIDGEADYVVDACFGPTNRARMADDEPNCGSPSIRTSKGVIIHEAEGVEGQIGGRLPNGDLLDGQDDGWGPDQGCSEDFYLGDGRPTGGPEIARDLLRQHGLRP